MGCHQSKYNNPQSVRKLHLDLPFENKIDLNIRQPDREQRTIHNRYNNVNMRENKNMPITRRVIL